MSGCGSWRVASRWFRLVKNKNVNAVGDPEAMFARPFYRDGEEGGSADEAKRGFNSPAISTVKR